MAGILADAMMGKSDNGYDRYLALQRMGRPLKPEEMAFMKQYEAQMSASPMPQGGGMGRMPQSEGSDLSFLPPQSQMQSKGQAVGSPMVGAETPLGMAFDTRMARSPAGGMGLDTLEKMGILDQPMEEMYSGKANIVGSPMLGGEGGMLRAEYPQYLKDSPLMRRRKRR